MPNCIKLINAYCTRRKLDKSKMKELVGANRSLKNNNNNWVTLDCILQTLKMIILKRYPARKNVIEARTKFTFTITRITLTSLYTSKNTTCVYYVMVITHTYKIKTHKIILTLYSKSKLILAQRRADYCGSSVIIIALEMIYLYKTYKNPSLLPETIYVSDREYKSIISKLHKYDSEKITVTTKFNLKDNKPTYYRVDTVYIQYLNLQPLFRAPEGPKRPFRYLTLI